MLLMRWYCWCADAADAADTLMLLFSHRFLPFLTVSHCFSPFLAVSCCFSPFLTISRRFSPFLTVSHTFSPFLIMSHHFSLFLTVSYFPLCPFCLLRPLQHFENSGEFLGFFNFLRFYYRVRQAKCTFSSSLSLLRSFFCLLHIFNTEFAQFTQV